MGSAADKASGALSGPADPPCQHPSLLQLPEKQGCWGELGGGGLRVPVGLCDCHYSPGPIRKGVFALVFPN